MAGPEWFIGVETLFDAVFVLVTALVSLAGFRAYMFFKERKYLLLAQGFFFLSASYLLLFVSNLLVYVKSYEAIPLLQRVIEIERIITTGFFLYAILFLIGLVLLIFLYFHIEDVVLRLLIGSLVVFGYMLAGKLTGMFYLLSSILLFFLVVQLYRSWSKSLTMRSLLVFFAIFGIFIGELLLAVLTFGPTMYVAANCVTLVGYLTMLASQVRR